VTERRPVKGTISISLSTKTPDSGSGMVDLGHDVSWLMKELPGLLFKDTNGKMRPLSDKYEVTSVHTDAHRAAMDD
jgi:hypothetical protein